MVARGIFYGTVAIFVALVIITSSFGLYYYGQNQRSSSQNQTYVAELNTALASYRSLSGSFNSSLGDYYGTLQLLANAVANLNTSTPAYQNASSALAYLWDDYQKLASGSGPLSYSFHMLVDFGNGTQRWFNDTRVQAGWNAYLGSLVLLDGKIQGSWYPQYGEHLVTGVDGVGESSTTSWFLWEFSAGKWTASQTGADQIQIVNGTTIAWTLCGYDASFNPTCTP